MAPERFRYQTVLEYSSSVLGLFPLRASTCTFFPVFVRPYRQWTDVNDDDYQGCSRSTTHLSALITESVDRINVCVWSNTCDPVLNARETTTTMFQSTDTSFRNLTDPTVSETTTTNGTFFFFIREKEKKNRVSCRFLPMARATSTTPSERERRRPLSLCSLSFALLRRRRNVRGSHKHDLYIAATAPPTRRRKSLNFTFEYLLHWLSKVAFPTV